MKIAGPLPPVLREPGQDRLERPRGRDGTFGFDELGVFGLKRRPAAVPPDGGRTPRCPEPRPSGATVPGKVLQQPPVIMTGPAPHDPAPYPGAPRSETPPAKTDEAGGPFHPDPEIWQPEPAFGDYGSEPLGLAPLSGPDGTREAFGPAPAPPEPAPAQGLHLSVQDGRVSVALKAPPLDTEGRALLRRLVREILAEHRLDLADFKLNGVPLRADFQDMTGGSHGPRAR